MERTVNAAGLAGLAGGQVNVGYELARQRVIPRMDGTQMAVISRDGILLRTMPCPVPGLGRGGLMVTRQKIHAGVIHAGKTATVICEDTSFRVIIDGETAAVVPRTTTSEVHRYKANATQRAAGDT